MTPLPLRDKVAFFAAGTLSRPQRNVFERQVLEEDIMWFQNSLSLGLF